MHFSLSLRDFISQTNDVLPENVHLKGGIDSETIQKLKKKSAKGVKNLTFTGLHFENEAAMTACVEFIYSCWGLQFLEIDLSYINDLATLQRMALLLKQVHIIPVMHLLNLRQDCPELVDAAENKAAILNISPNNKSHQDLAFGLNYIKNLEDHTLAIYMYHELLGTGNAEWAGTIKRELCLRYIKTGDLVAASQYMAHENWWLKDEERTREDKETQRVIIRHRAPFVKMASSFDSETTYWSYYLFLATRHFLELSAEERVAIEREARAFFLPDANDQTFRIVALEEIQQVLSEVLKADPLNLTCRIIQRKLPFYSPQQILRIGEHPLLKKRFEAVFGTSRLVSVTTLLDQSDARGSLLTSLNKPISAPDADFYKLAEVPLAESPEKILLRKVNDHMKRMAAQFSLLADPELSEDKIAAFAFARYSNLIAKQFSEVAVMLFGMCPGSADIDILYHTIISLCLKKAGFPEMLMEYKANTPEELALFLQKNTNLIKVTIECKCNDNSIASYLSHLQGHKTLVSLRVVGKHHHGSNNLFLDIAEFLNKNPNVKDVSMKLAKSHLPVCIGTSFREDQSVVISYKYEYLWNEFTTKSRTITGTLPCLHSELNSENIHHLLHPQNSVSIDHKALSAAFAQNGQLILSLYWMFKTQARDVDLISNLAPAILALPPESRAALFGSNKDGFKFLFYHCMSLDSANLKKLSDIAGIKQCYAMLVYSRFDFSDTIELITLPVLQQEFADFLSRSPDLSDNDVCLFRLFLDAVDKMSVMEFRVIASMLKDKFPAIPLTKNSIVIESLLAHADELKDNVPASPDDVVACVVALLDKPSYSCAEQKKSLGTKIEEGLKVRLQKEFSWFDRLYSHYKKGLLYVRKTQDEKLDLLQQSIHITPFVHYCAHTIMWHVVRDIMMDLSLKMGLNPASTEFEDLVEALALSMRNSLTGESSKDPIFILEKNMYHGQVM
ncbi:hypothetical protein [Legionella shakespearei]|uniref:Uncharacterized protein n=2 Tax=Legionella shakespearei TaxID=45075 RepID=A0A0W0Z736_9GAMM|nr:hypothetical protein [Legionella shakespearei]KTD64924.1 hypothetical protein Lsha_0293 [Legionella shakespearei DSM 23087]